MTTTTQPIPSTEVFAPCNRNTIPCPPPGIYPSSSFSMEDYHKIDAVNASTIKAFMKSGMDGKVYLDGPPSEPSNSMLIGTATHARVFEPELYRETAILGLHKGKPLADTCVYWKHKEVQEENPGAIILHEGWSERIEGVAQQVENSPEIARLFRDPNALREVMMIWTELVPYNGTTIEVPFKDRLDMFNPTMQAIIDLKSTKDSSPRKFQYQIVDLGYHISAGIYVRGCIKHGLIGRDEMGRLPDGPYVAVAAETKPPYFTTPYPMPISTVEQGYEDAMMIGLRRLMEYRVDGIVGPRQYEHMGHQYRSDELIDLGIPDWAMRENAGTVVPIGH